MQLKSGEPRQSRKAATVTDFFRVQGSTSGEPAARKRVRVGSVERTVLPKAHRMKELGIVALKDIPTIEPVNDIPRPVELPKRD